MNVVANEINSWYIIKWYNYTRTRTLEMVPRGHSLGGIVRRK